MSRKCDKFHISSNSQKSYIDVIHEEILKNFNKWNIFRHILSSIDWLVLLIFPVFYGNLMQINCAQIKWAKHVNFTHTRMNWMQQNQIYLNIFNSNKNLHSVNELNCKFCTVTVEIHTFSISPSHSAPFLVSLSSPHSPIPSLSLATSVCGSFFTAIFSCLLAGFRKYSICLLY